jgi:hypothetical protein
MGSDTQEHPRTIFRRILKLACVCLLLVAALPYLPTCHPKPPDLTTCTRLKVRYAVGALNYFFPDTSMQKEVLNEEEREYIRSYDRWTVTDQGQIKAFAQQVGQGTDPRWLGVWALVAPLCSDPPSKIVGYQPWRRRVSFSVYGGSEITAGGYFFSYYPGHGLSLASLDPPRLKPLRARWDCGRHVSWLIYLSLCGGPPPVRPHFDPNHWCDTIVENARKNYTAAGIANEKKVRVYPDIYIAGVFTCPGIHACPDVYDYRRVRESSASSQPVGIWISDYAMNPNCREDSPKDMVFLFESKPGWNQHGGPELFTFDNHDPKGGLVLLNDGKVKFIRTEEELKQLRWK